MKGFIMFFAFCLGNNKYGNRKTKEGAIKMIKKQKEKDIKAIEEAIKIAKEKGCDGLVKRFEIQLSELKQEKLF